MIEVRAVYKGRPSHLLKVSVSDTGSGIDKSDRCKLFNRFGKLHKTAALTDEGTGLGLEIVSKIVHAAGGEV